MIRTQENRAIAIDTPLGKDVLLLQSMSGSERLGQIFQFELELLSHKHDINFANIVGQNVTIRLNLSDGEIRYFNGYVSQFFQTESRGELARYQATVVPWLWFLTRTADCRIFQGKTVPEIIKEVFREHGFTDIKDSLMEKYRTWDYCAQYRETDYNFVNRLMEQEGIYYFFEHEDEKHSIVLSDSINAHESYPGYDQIRYRPTYGALSTSEYIWDWLVASNIQPGMYKLNDFDYRNVKADILAVAKDPDADSQTAAGHAVSELEIFDYPGEYVDEKTESARQDGDRYARVRSQELQAQKLICRARSDARGVAAGYLFELADHRRDDQNREYLVTSANYRMTTEPYETDSQQTHNEPVFSCEFTAISSDQPYRPPRVTALPMIRGPQTATVVGPEGKEIFTDKYGRVKVQFRWDRYGKSDENSSCWVRVSQSWAGGKTREGAPQPHWGSMHIPHIGDEVIVEFLEGDPDHPIITGRVYNADNVPPMDLPENKHKSIFRDNYGNELVFDATPEDEHIRLYSPHNHSLFELGKSVKWRTSSDKEHMISGNVYEAALGNKATFLAGVDANAVAGLRFLTSILGRGEITAGLRTDIQLGPKTEYQKWGPAYRAGNSTRITDTTKPIIDNTSDFMVLDADKHMMVVGGANDRCTMLFDNDGMNLRVWPAGQQGGITSELDKARRSELNNKAATVALMTAAAGFAASIAVCSSDMAKNRMKGGWAGPTFSSIALAVCAAIAGVMYWKYAKKQSAEVEKLYDKRLDQIKKPGPVARIELKDKGGIEIVSDEKLSLSSSSSSIFLEAPNGEILVKTKLKHKNFEVL